MIDSFESSVNTELNEARDKSGTLAFKNLSPLNKIQKHGFSRFKRNEHKHFIDYGLCWIVEC